MTEPLLRAVGVARRYGDLEALAPTDLDLLGSETVALVGPNGAGKSSMLNVLNGFYQPQRGVIRFRGREFHGMKPHTAATMGIGRTFQNIALFRGMTVLDNIMLGRHVRMKAGILSSFVYWGLAQREEVAHRARVEELVDFLELQDLRKQQTSATQAQYQQYCQGQ